MKLTREQLELARLGGALLERAYPGGDLQPNVVGRKTDTQVLVKSFAPGRTAVIVPGTASLRDVVTDIYILKSRWHVGYIHSGVMAAVNEVEDAVRALLPLRDEVIFLGHSLGAGIAQALAHRLVGWRAIGQVITFGGLRTFNGAAADDYNGLLGSKTLRFTAQGDPVPHGPLPVPVPRSGIYTQTDHEIYLPNDGGYEMDRPWYSVALPFCAAVAAVIQAKSNPAVLDFVSVAAHSMASYNLRLKELST